MQNLVRVSSIILALAACAVLAWSSSASASVRVQPKLGAIMGVVVDDAGEPVAGAVVALLGKDGKPVRHTHSNPDGKFGFKDVAPGERALKAAKKEVGLGGTIAKVVPGEVTKVKVELKKK